ncbi:peptide-methionine (S)-S-oxide reductase [Cellulophaga sp. Hel_I_12]|uniref:peptide-methionine (S)-S-oxide reductase n=1 Tax=Cellulophaga sp. Hel_I_12 TaxID=1249972 RepID=UPI00068AD517|nr:peptide-methionine (S)-S-oxide reductase [Cellulophaga sp. Hel_I_12]
MTDIQEIGFGGGCHWCTEAVFQNLKGVRHVQQGWIASIGKNEAYSEAVWLHFDRDQIDLKTLIEIHLHTHKSTSNHSMRKKYRSAVYTFSEVQKKMAERLVKNLQTDFDKPIITQVLPFQAFKPSEESVQNYYVKNPEKPFCTSFIEPKLKIVLTKFSQYTRAIKEKSFITKPLVDKKSKM